jgi:hypothetical protein
MSSMNSLSFAFAASAAVSINLPVDCILSNSLTSDEFNTLGPRQPGFSPVSL